MGMETNVVETVLPSVAPAAPGTPQARIEELGRIILAYSEITERLQKSHEQLTLTVQKLRTELGEKNKELERRNRLAALGEMAAGMAHEIRNPLGAIQLYASLLAADVAGMPESAKTVEKVRGGVRRLEEIVSKVLNFSRDLRVSPVEGLISELVAETVELASAKAKEKGVRIVSHGADGLVGRFDRVMMSQAVLNLSLNAIDASPNGSVVRIDFQEDKGQTVIRVSDSGPGVAAEVMDRIFNPFFTTKDDGTGLGLSIVHRVAEAHDGTVAVRNEGGGGAVFEIRW